MAAPPRHHYAPGSLARARGRDWVALPADEPDILRGRRIPTGTPYQTCLTPTPG